MNSIMDFLPIVIVVILAFALIGKFKGSGGADATEDNFRTANEIISRWKKESVAAKIEIAFSTIYFLGIMLLMLYLSFGDKIGLEPLIDFEGMFEGKSDEEMLDFFTNDIIKYIVGFFAIFMIGGLITALLGTNSFFDLAKWLKRNDINCYPILQKSSGDKAFNFLLGNGYLIKERPATKNIFYIRTAGIVTINILFITSISNFLKSFIVQTYEAFEVYNMEPGEWAKQAFTSSDATFFYIVLIVMLSFNFVINKILRNKQGELINSIVQNANEE